MMGSQHHVATKTRVNSLAWFVASPVEQADPIIQVVKVTFPSWRQQAVYLAVLVRGLHLHTNITSTGSAHVRISTTTGAANGFNREVRAWGRVFLGEATPPPRGRSPQVLQ